MLRPVAVVPVRKPMQEQSLGPSPMQRGRAQPSQVRKEAALSDCTCVTWSAWTRFYKDARGKHELLPRASFFNSYSTYSNLMSLGISGNDGVIRKPDRSLLFSLSQKPSKEGCGTTAVRAGSKTAAGEVSGGSGDSKGSATGSGRTSS